MKILFLVPLALTVSAIDKAAEPDSAVSEEIVVLGKRIDNWQGKYSVKGSKVKCATKKSSGDKAIDAIGCQAFVDCLTPLQARLAESDNTALPKETRLAMKNAIKADLSICVKDRRDVLIVDLAERRYQEKQK